MESRPVNQIFSFFPAQKTIHRLPLFLRDKQPFCALVDLDQLSLLLEQQTSDLPAALLSKEEQIFFTRFNYPKRRREWLGGRIAAKAAMLACPDNESSLSRMNEITILPDEHGRPVTGSGIKQMVSISHSSQFAVACAAKQGVCGIDLQKISSKLPGLTSRFTSSNEQQLLARQYPDFPEDIRLTMIWTTKEAVKKSMLHDQPSVFSGITINQVLPEKKNKHLFFCKVTGYAQPQQVTVHVFPPYILALTGGENA